jgi:hypothetical protein
MLDPLIADLRRIYEGNAWHGPPCSRPLRAQTRSRPRRVLGKRALDLQADSPSVRGSARSRPRLQNAPGMPADGDFRPQGTRVDSAAWADVCAARAPTAELLETVAGFDQDRLDDAVNPKNKGVDGPVTFRALLAARTTQRLSRGADLDPQRGRPRAEDRTVTHESRVTSHESRVTSHESRPLQDPRPDPHRLRRRVPVHYDRLDGA